MASKKWEKDTPAARRVKFRDLLTDYQKVIHRKKSGDKEHLKIDALKKRFPAPMDKLIGDIMKSDIAQWHDAMLDTPNGRGGTRPNKRQTCKTHSSILKCLLSVNPRRCLISMTYWTISSRGTLANGMSHLS